MRAGIRRSTKTLHGAEGCTATLQTLQVSARARWRPPAAGWLTRRSPGRESPPAMRPESCRRRRLQPPVLALAALSACRRPQGRSGSRAGRPRRSCHRRVPARSPPQVAVAAAACCALAAGRAAEAGWWAARRLAALPAQAAPLASLTAPLAGPPTAAAAGCCRQAPTAPGAVFLAGPPLAAAAAELRRAAPAPGCSAAPRCPQTLQRLPPSRRLPRAARRQIATERRGAAAGQRERERRPGGCARLQRRAASPVCYGRRAGVPGRQSRLQVARATRKRLQVTWRGTGQRCGRPGRAQWRGRQAAPGRCRQIPLFTCGRGQPPRPKLFRG